VAGGFDVDVEPPVGSTSPGVEMNFDVGEVTGPAEDPTLAHPAPSKTMAEIAAA
jgi:hypothetical protein